MSSSYVVTDLVQSFACLLNEHSDNITSKTHESFVWNPKVITFNRMVINMSLTNSHSIIDFIKVNVVHLIRFELLAGLIPTAQWELIKRSRLVYWTFRFLFVGLSR